MSRTPSLAADPVAAVAARAARVAVAACGALVAGAALVALSACGGEAPAPASGGHAHVAPNGGKLIELGEHAANLELLYDRSSGKVRVNVLDAHAEGYVRIKSPELVLVRADEPPIALQALGNDLSGETVGDSSRFEGVLADKPSTWTAHVTTLEVRGMHFENVAIRYP